MGVLHPVNDRHEDAILATAREGVAFPREIVAYAVWVCHRFALSTADVEDLLAAHDRINTVFRPRRNQLAAVSYRHAPADAFDLWNAYAAEIPA